MMTPRCWLAMVLTAATPAAALAQEPAKEMIRPDGPSPPEAPPPPLMAITPPDLVPPVVPQKVWQQQLRKLRIQAGISWIFTGIGIVGLSIPLGILASCDEDDVLAHCPDRRGAIIAAPIFGALAAASLIPAVIYTDRLVYRQVPERAPQLGLSPSGVMLRF